VLDEHRLGARLGCGVPGRISSPQTIAPTATIAADHPNAVVYPWTAASAVEWCDAVKLLVALAATVLSSAVPIEPPICCIVLTLAEATLASAERTPRVAVFIPVDIAIPRPRPRTSRAGRTSAPYVESAAGALTSLRRLKTGVCR
jgi:hypothetical protein